MANKSFSSNRKNFRKIFSVKTSNGVWYVYVLQNKEKRWYIGSTKNLQKRILTHNSFKNKSTKHGAPWKIIYCEIGLNREDARAREKYLKSGMGRKYLKNRLKFFFAKNF